MMLQTFLHIMSNLLVGSHIYKLIPTILVVCIITTSVCSSQIELGVQESFSYQIILYVLYSVYWIILFRVGICGLLNTY